MRFIKRLNIFKEIYHSGIIYPTPININWWWNFGFLAAICLIIQIVTGIFLAMHYIAHADYAFFSVEHIMRNVNYGWLLRYTHANGASFFFLVVYIHVFRGLYYGSYMHPRQIVWGIGVVILLLMILTAFMGYVLPWGQMSFWAATVITNLASAIPLIGLDIVYWLWGGFSVDQPTLIRFFSLHYLFPFIILALVVIHIIFLHEFKSNNPLGINLHYVDKIYLSPYFMLKDFLGLVIYFFTFFFIVYFYPNVLGHPDNYIQADPLVTPAHIVPEWYFLPFYAILRAIPNKLGGVIAMLFAILVLIILPFYNNSKIKTMQFKPLNKFFFWIFFVNCLLLGWIGSNPAEDPYIIIGQVCTIFYFFYLIIILPLLSKIEDFLIFRKIKIKNYF